MYRGGYTLKTIFPAHENIMYILTEDKVCENSSIIMNLETDSISGHSYQHPPRNLSATPPPLFPTWPAAGPRGREEG